MLSDWQLPEWVCTVCGVKVQTEEPIRHHQMTAEFVVVQKVLSCWNRVQRRAVLLKLTAVM